MTISSEISRVDYVGNGATSVYPYTFKILSESDLLVTVRDTNDAESTLTYPSNFTVTGVGESSGGSITLLAGNLASGYAITIRRQLTLVQEADIRNQGAFYREVHEDVFDRLTMVDQQLHDENLRTLKIPESEVGTVTNTVLPAASSRANKILGFDSSGNPSTYTSIPVGSLAVSSYMETLLDDGTAQVARGTLSAARSAWIDARDYGVIGNGVADDTAAIQAAINATAGLGYGGNVYFHSGRYLVTSEILIPGGAVGGVRIYGEKEGGTMFLRGPAYSSGDIFRAEGVSNPLANPFIMEDITIVGDGGVYVASGYAIHLDGRVVSRLNRIMIYDGFGGVKINNVSDCHVSDVRFLQSSNYATTKGNSEAGFWIGGIISDLTFRRCNAGGENTTVANTLDTGMWIRGADGIQVADSFFQGESGIKLSANNGNNIDDVYFSNTLVDNTRAYAVKIEGNNFGTGNVYTNVKFTGCHLNARIDSGQPTVGVHISGDIDNIQFLGCNINENGAQGIVVQNQDSYNGVPREGVLFVGCDITGNNRLNNPATSSNVHLDTNVSGISFIGCDMANRTSSIGSTNFGVYMQGGNDSIRIVGSRLTPVGTSGIGYGGAVTKVEIVGCKDQDNKFNDSINIVTAGKSVNIKEGSNAKMGLATLIAGVVVVNTTAVTANSRIMLTPQIAGGTPGFVRVSARAAGTSFTITSSSGTDTSSIAWVIFEPA